jgi:phospholipid N-methyltransferase
MLIMKKQLRFFKEYCKNIKEIGSVVPDSKTCVNSLLRLVPFDTAKVIVEFGSASGAVTREIIKRKRPETLFISFEKNPRLHAPLQESIKAKNVYLVNEDVFNCSKVLWDVFGLKEKSVDCIVSTLPCSCLDFDRLVKQSVLPVLKEKGHFIQYMHTLSLLKGFNLKRFLGKYFVRMHSDFVLFNIPPALVYTCHTPHPTVRKP